MPDDSNKSAEMGAILRRMDLLERENQRLREKLEPIVGPDNPCFSPHVFQRILRARIMLMSLPMYLILLMPLVPLAFRGSLPRWYIGRVPVVDLAGTASGVPGMGLGLIAFGGGALGVVAIGGVGVGVIACGGGAVGLIAFGGGAVGLVAIGGGAAGYIAIGGNARGRYALGYRGGGRFVFAMNRQDPEAVELFARVMPSLRRAMATPMPVIPIEKNETEERKAS